CVCAELCRKSRIRFRRLRGRVPTEATPMGGGCAPTACRGLLRDLDRARLADNGHLDLPRILELLLDRARDLVREQDGAVVVDLARTHHHSDLPSGLKRVGLL